MKMGSSLWGSFTSLLGEEYKLNLTFVFTARNTVPRCAYDSAMRRRRSWRRAASRWCTWRATRASVSSQ